MNFVQVGKICERHGAEFLKDAPLCAFTTFKVGGSCDALVKINSREVLRAVILCCKHEEIPFRVLGKGSNVLVSDGGFRGVILLLGNDFAEIDISENVITCLSGAALTNVSITARNNSLSGLEFAYGIPGTVGGAVYMNAGAYGGEISDVFLSCDYLDLEDCGFKTLERENASFGYRKSPFTASIKGVVLSAKFRLFSAESTEITAKMDDFMSRRKDKQPLEYPSAGSVFKRPENDYASRLVDVCGLKGLTVGGAQVSEKHAGFIINRGGATCKDVLELIELVTEKVFKETGIMLEREVELL